EPRRILAVHQHVFTTRAGQRVALALYDAVELLAAPRRQPQSPAARLVRNGKHGKDCAARRRWKMRCRCSARITSFAKAWAAPLQLIAGIAQSLNAVVSRHRAGNLLAYLLRIFEMHQARVIGPRAFSDAHRDFPLSQRFADAPTGNLRAEQDAPLS